MATATDPQTPKRLALAILDFLQTSTTDGTIPAEDHESVEVARSCIADAFKVDATDTTATAEALGPGQSLLSIYSVYEKLKGRSNASTSSAGTSGTDGQPETPTPPAAAAKNSAAEQFKGQGNAAMAAKDYPKAIDSYSKAIELSPTDAIYLSNRAAAYSATGKHELAIQDAEVATSSQPGYSKAWSRLGLARFAVGDARGSMEAYERGIQAEGKGGSEAMRKGFETAKRKVEQLEGPEAADEVERDMGGAGGGMPDLASLLGGMGGGAGGGGGMPDLSSLMNNPMMRQMAQNVMQNPDMMNNIMNNPRLREMAGQAGRGGGMPDLSSLMQDPSIAEMARNFMGGAGGAGGAGGGAGGSA